MTPSRDSTDPTPDPRCPTCGLSNPGPEHAAYQPMLCREEDVRYVERRSALLDALGPMVPLARAQADLQRRSSVDHATANAEVARLRERAERAEEAARAFAAFLRRVEDFSNDSWLALEATAVLLGHPGFLPDTAQDSSPKREEPLSTGERRPHAVSSRLSAGSPNALIGDGPRDAVDRATDA